MKGQRARAAIVVATAAVAVAPAAATAAAPWSTPVTISAAHGAIGPVGITNTNTSTVAWWRWQDGAGAGAKLGSAFAARPDGDGAFLPERSLVSDDLVSLDVQGYGDGRLLSLSQLAGHGPVREGSPNPPQDVLVRNGSARGFPVPSKLARAHLVEAAQLGVAEGGRALVAFASFDPKIAHRAIVSAAVRSPSGRFTRPAVISGRGDAHGVVAAIGRRGDMVVAFVRNRKVMARVRRPGHGWGAIQTLATPAGPTKWTLRAAVSDAGSVEVLWLRRFVSDRKDRAALQARRMAPGASRWGAHMTIEPTGATVPSELVEVPGGFAVGYTVRGVGAGSRTTARVSMIRPRTSTRLDVAPAPAGVRDVRLAWSDRHGLFATMVMLPAVGDGVAPGVGALLAPGASSFGALERVTSGDSVQDLAPGFGRDGAPVVVWSSPPDGTDAGIPGDPLRRVVRSSTRTG